MNLGDVLQQIHRQQLFLRHGTAGRVVFWSCGQRVPRTTRQAIAAHRQELAEMLARHDVNVCPVPGLHRQEWRYGGNGRYVCGACERLQVA